jgi:hypothetical protein
VNISANAAPSGQTFDKWTGDVSGVANVNNASTTYTMGSANATVTATYKALPPTTYTLTVNSGSGGGSYTAGSVVNISANAAPNGKQFKNWTSSGGGSFGNANSANTTFTMPSNAVTITANYEDIPPTPSSDATLSGLTLDVPGLTPAFSPNIFGYTATVATSVADITITATANNGGATISGTGTYPLVVGTNVFTITVTAEDGTVKTYTITVNRETDTGIEAVGNSGVTVYSSGASLVVKSSGVEIKTVEVFALTGAKVYGSAVNGTETVVYGLPKGILIVRVRQGDGNAVVRKTVIR